MTRIAIIQQKPAFNNIEACIRNASLYIVDAKQQGADIVVFGENWFSGYPFWIDHCPNVAKWDHDPVKSVWANMYQNGLALNSEHIISLQSLAKEHELYLVLGANEPIFEGPGNSSLYNTVFTIDDQGEIQNHHRKLMPTFNEKLIHNQGDGAGLKTVDSKFGKIGALICWEHWMPLARQVMHDCAEDIHFALWPCVKEQHIIACRQYAIEGRCYVIAVGQIAHVYDTPKGLSLSNEHQTDPNAYALNGGSCVFGPNGEPILSPQYENEEIIYVDLPAREALIKERMNLAVSGHYQRPDIFKLNVKKERYF